MDERLRHLQEDMELSAIEITKDRYDKNMAKLLEKGMASESSPAIVLIARNTTSLAKAVEEFMFPEKKTKGWNAGRKAHTRGLLRGLDLNPFELAYATLKTSFNSIRTYGDPITFQALAMKLSRLLEVESNYKHLRRTEPKLERAIRTHVKLNDKSKSIHQKAIEQELRKTDVPLMKLTTDERFAVGTKLLELTLSTTSMFHQIKIKRGKRNTVYSMVFTDEVEEFFKNTSDLFAFFSPTYRPMVVKPRPWKGVRSGGYLTSNERYSPLLVRGITKEQEKLIEEGDISKVLDAVNIAQETPWLINTDILDVQEYLWENGGGVGGVPEADDLPEPSRPWGEMSKEEWQNYKEANRENVKKFLEISHDIKTKNRTLTSKRHLFAVQLGIAQEYAKFDEIYFPHNLDFRGRVYPIPNSLNPQGDDISKSLLMFKKGKKLNKAGFYWFRVGAANVWGEDKDTFDARVRWFDENRYWIEQCGKEPLKYRQWLGADKPFQFLAFAMEYVQFLVDPMRFESRLPVNMDGTCNGLQHLSAMLRDEVGGKAVNLMDLEEPQDIYTEVADALLDIVNQDEASNKDRKFAQIWKNKVSRKLVKRGTMTTPYGVSQFGMREQILNEWKNELDGYTVDKFRGCVYIANHLDDAIKTVVVGAREVMNWFHDIADDYLGREGKTLKWVTPLTNFPVVQGYKKRNTKRINMFMGVQRVRLSLNEDTEKVNRARQLSGFSPNLVHSIDAAMLMETVRRLRRMGVESFSLVHDSYGTHARDVDMLHQVLRRVFYQIYRDGEFLERLRESLGSEIAPPKQGNLNIKEVLRSKYLFN